MEKEPGFFVKDTDNLRSRLIITSEAVKKSRLEWAWRIGITVAVSASIIMQIL
ncbi:hypothetical protein [Phocaeicola vulgatus]|jgi:hypothetical protein|uniref:hypothetical protein n=1 Tax=Phocaeicola vulgatus TaxID=821 RepID=UPI0012F73C86|nr:hypothetical protein [Phocaeicola vulgatus]MCS2371718.1 hypothetical protein [Phocaeicola vulgatus]